MKILQINTVYGKGSTGKIAKNIHDICKVEDIECLSGCRYYESGIEKKDDTITVSSWLDCHIHNRIVKYSNLQGCFSGIKTLLFLRKVKKYSPDLIHLHNIHGNYINFSLLFNYIKKNKIPVVWTLHDCWSFTGQCPHFTIAGCNKWKTECDKCSQYKDTFNLIKKMYKLKKKWFTGIRNMTIVTPSEWLSNLVKQSFMKEYPVKIINNGIDLNVFKPRESDFRSKYGISENKNVILGVAFDWGKRKGLDVFINLAEKLDKEKYQIVLVGTNENIDRQLPGNIISIHRTQNQKELAEIYTAADLFINPTREDTFPTVNIEANACGTPVLTFNTGGSPECIDEASGSVVECDDIDALEKEIVRICNDKPYSMEDCIRRATSFDKYERFNDYVELYREVTEF